MRLRYLVVEKTDEPIVTFQKSLIAARQVFVITGILKQESKVMNQIYQIIN